ncbi:MAG: uroporphyrinogen decarboxylase family protein [bacterium]|nr:uroporphyrinogen decarboxylase family protein [bacterium]
MNSKERILSALTGKGVDYIPCAPTFWRGPNFWRPVEEVNFDVDPKLNDINKHVDNKYRWSTLEEQINVMLNVLGVDPVLSIDVSFSKNLKNVEEKKWIEKKGERKILHKEFHTPAGILSASVNLEHWPHGEDIPFCTNWVASYTKYWVESLEDIEKLKYVLLAPDDESMKKDIESNKQMFSLARKYQLPICSSIGAGLTRLLQLMGADNVCIATIERPEIIESYLEYEHSLNKKRMEIAIDFGVDFFGRDGFYETCDFYSPQQLESFLKSHLEEEIDVAHSAEKPIYYTLCTGIMPMLDYANKLNFDCINSIEPALDNNDLRKIDNSLPGKTLWTGVSAPIHIGSDNEEDVREAVRYAIKNVNHLILGVAPSIRNYWHFENTLAMIDEWKHLKTKN